MTFLVPIFPCLQRMRTMTKHLKYQKEHSGACPVSQHSRDKTEWSFRIILRRWGEGGQPEHYEFLFKNKKKTKTSACSWYLSYPIYILLSISWEGDVNNSSSVARIRKILQGHHLLQFRLPHSYVIHLACFSLCISQIAFSCFLPCPLLQIWLAISVSGFKHYNLSFLSLSHVEIGTRFLGIIELILWWAFLIQRLLHFSFTSINLLYEFTRAAIERVTHFKD